jgi:hypothetical protein
MDIQLAKVIESSDKPFKSNSLDMDIGLPLLFDASALVRSLIALSQYGTAAYKFLTLECRCKKRIYVLGIPYNVYETASKSTDAKLEPAPVIGKPLYIEITRIYSYF